LNLGSLSEQPFELLVALEKRARAAIASREGRDGGGEEWVGVGFRLGAESFVAPRGDVREVLPVPDSMTRVPGAKPWLRGIANVRGQLLTIVDVKAFLGGGISIPDRRARILITASREIPAGLMVDEVTGFRRFHLTDFDEETPATLIRCENYVEGGYRQGSEVWPCFQLLRLLADEQFLSAGEVAEA
jgi:twitching motility protein PilI